MQKARYLIALSCAAACGACGTEVATAVNIAPTADAGTPGLPEKPPVCTSTRLTSRLSSGKVTLPEGVRYRRTGYYFGFPQDDRIAFSTSNGNTSMVAWVTSGGTQVHVTPVTTPDLAHVGDELRAGPDAFIDGTDLSGLVAFEDGFAVLTRRPDPGELIDGIVQQATFLVRLQNGHERFAVPLTGSKSITDAPDTEKRDYPLGLVPIGLSGRLAFDGAQYGAYFAVRGGAGSSGIADRYNGANSDKLVQVDDNGQFISSFRAACRQNLGGRIVPDMGGFVPFCMSDGTVGTAGLYVALGARSTRWLATETTFSSGNYSGGNFGSAVKLPNGYIVVWASRGVGGNGPHDSHEPAVAPVTKDLKLAATPFWPFLADSQMEPLEDAVNVHAAPYGDKVLVVWETIASPQFRPSTGVSTGDYGGTHFRLIDAAGKAASDPEQLPDDYAPNGSDDIVQMPNGDLVWAYVPEPRNFLQFAAASQQPTISEIKLVKFQYCIPP